MLGGSSCVDSSRSRRRLPSEERRCACEEPLFRLAAHLADEADALHVDVGFDSAAEVLLLTCLDGAGDHQRAASEAGGRNRPVGAFVAMPRPMNR